MKRFLSVSLVAMLAMSPMIASATDTCPGAPDSNCESKVGDAAPSGGYALATSATHDDTNVVTASYVKGAYNDLTRKVNKVAADAASGATTKITEAAGNGLAGSNGKLSVDLATNSGLDLTGSTDGSKQLAVKLSNDGTLVNDSGSLKVGTIANANVAANAAIDQSKISGLTDALAGKQAKLTYMNGETATDINTTVVKTVAAANSASDANLASEKAIATALAGKHGTLTNDDQTANADLSVGTTVLTTVGATGTHNNLVTEKAVRDAITAATSTAGMVTTTGLAAGASGYDIDAKSLEVQNVPVVTTTTLNNKTLAVNASSAKVNDVDVVTVSGTQTLAGKSIDADDNTISDLKTSNFQSGVVVNSTTGIAATSSALDTALPTEKAVAAALDGKQGKLTNGATGEGAQPNINTLVKTAVATTGASNNDLVTEKAVRDAITAATTTAGMVTATTLGNKSLAVNASSLKVNDKDAATQTAVVNTINSSTVTIPVLATWGSTASSAGNVVTVSSGAYAEPVSNPT